MGASQFESMPSFFEGIQDAIQRGFLPKQDLEISPSPRGQGWNALSPAEQDAMVNAVKDLFEAHSKCVIKYTPMLHQAQLYYRPVGCAPEAVIRTLLSGEQQLYDLDEEGSSCCWMHIFGENEGISHINFVGLQDLERSRSRSRSRTPSRKRPRPSADDLPALPTTSRAQRPRYARQGSAGYFPFQLLPLASRFIDLSHAQIYPTEVSQYEVKHCLISSLEYYGVDATALSDVSRSIQNFATYIPKKAFKSIAEKCKVNFHVRQYNNSTKARSGTYLYHVDCGEENARELRLGIYHDHVFPDIETEYSSFFIRNLAAVTKLVDSGRIPSAKAKFLTKIRADGKVEYGKRQPLRTSSVINQLMVENHFQRVGPSKIIKAAASKKGDLVALEEYHFETCQRLWEFRATGSRDPPSDVEDATADVEPNGYQDQNDDSYVYYACDFESFVNGDYHVPCLAGCMELDSEKGVVTDPQAVHVFEGENLVCDLFRHIVFDIKDKETARGSRFSHRVIFLHNLRYDRCACTHTHTPAHFFFFLKTHSLFI